MLKTNDLIRLPYAPDLTPTGIAYACRSLPHTYDRMGGSEILRLRRIVAGKAVELAFRRYLTAQNVPYDDLGATPFTDPDHYDIGFGGRRCDIKSFLFTQKREIHRIHRSPSILLSASALVPTEQDASGSLADDDLYIFAFLTALVTDHPKELDRALAAGQPSFIIFALPEAWAHPLDWLPLGPLALKSECATTITIEAGGQDANRVFQTEQANLHPGVRTHLHTEFYSLAYLHTPNIPVGRVGLHSRHFDQLTIVKAHEWGNIWVYGMSIIFTGYMSCGEFRRRAADLPPGSRVMQYAQTRTHNRSLLIADLHPLADLFNSARKRDFSEMAT
jgi:hypothetical protein